MKALSPDKELRRRGKQTVDEALKNLTRLAAHLSETPIALICLSEQKRYWLTSQEKWKELYVSRAIAFCAKIIQHDLVFVFEDASKDARLATSPLVVGKPHIRFCAGAALVARNGRTLGCLCVMDNVARKISPEKLEILQMLAAQASAQLQCCIELAKVKISQIKLQNSLEKASVLIQTTRLSDSSLIYVNQGWRQSLGYNNSEIAQLSVWDILHPEYHQQYTNLLEKLRRGEEIEKAKLIFLTKTGEAIWVEGNANCLRKKGQPQAARWILQDTSDRKYRELFEHAAIGLFQASLDGCYHTVNPALAKIYGYDSPVELIQSIENISKLYVDPHHWADCMQKLEAEDCIQDLESEVYQRNGSVIWVCETIRLLRDENGQPKGIEGTVQDITIRKQAEATLRLARNQLQAVLDAVPGSVSLISSNFRYLGVNRHLAASYNLSPEAFVGREIGFLQPAFAEFVREFFASPDEEVWREIEIDINGTPRTHLMMAKKWLANEAAVFVGIDISDRKLAEANLKVAKAQLQAVLDAVPGTVSLINSQLRYVGVNRHLASIYNFPPEYFIDREVGFQQSDFGKFVREFFSIPAEEASREIDTEVNGIFRSDMVIAKKWQEDKAVFVGIDITQRKQAEAALKAELAEAAEYVRSLLPPAITEPLAIEWRFIPSTQVGGDCFDYYWLDDEHLAIYLLDVSGHGSRAALLSVSLLNILRSRFLPNTNFYQPSEVLQALNHAFQMDMQRNMYFTIWYGVYNRIKRRLVYSSAGHPPALLLSRSPAGTTEIRQLQTRSLPIGMFSNIEYNNVKCDIKTPSTLYVFSDGIYEIHLADGNLWGLDNFIEWLSKAWNLNNFSLDNIIEHARGLSTRHAFDDDVSLLQVKFNT
ncbi:MAG: SpoIIE family protein phosphatase [Oscillatoriaceae bacterium SKW80]|nr:SpoIIE family protein phosphatase [Oscillatoriaceae bacterium SKYG93]MCX8120119.1 SpoIIE family protein phosphatase [Oscillatoriaceae bacterium SKW80]MDW8453045.1 SpoIIE family protein phosphatase [Oscillatoriaceae cyanobacterium SKYGB_i_bin93]HIK29044.1 SpoIIE family protein phosphatase [Oscillatoriaceae cyanobacterium M7585_C2015_266]